uniref:Secreted protein n=1 Tax=Globodera rostochiensis TaxID=31243 RepID=A0A914HNJ5_GLORO
MFWILFLVSFFATNSIDKTEFVQLEELDDLSLQTFDELFVEEWWDKDEAEDLKMPAPTNFGQNVHHQIDRQNTQIGQIEPNPTDQNPPLTESDHSDNANSSENITEDERKRGKVNLAKPNQTKNTPTANERNC